MLRPTQRLQFRPLSALARFSIHQPLPLNPRESKVLLNLLTTSFRQHLDREHGQESMRPKADGKGTASWTTSNNTHIKRRNSLSTPETRSPTDRHLNAILTNPLFSYGTEKADVSMTAKRDPMDLFDEACAKGLMKVEYAGACLRAKKNLIVQSAVLDVREGLKNSKAGSKVLKWLVSSRGVDDTAFLENELFSEILIEYLAAENLQEVVWTWLQKRLLIDSTSSPQSYRIPANLLFQLVKAEASRTISLDAAYASFIRASEILKSHMVPGRRILYRPGRFLARESTSISSHLPPSPDTFEAFLKTVPLFSPIPKLQLAHLNLYHPTEPNASLALQLLREAKKAFTSGFATDEPSFRNLPKIFPEWQIISIGLDTAKYLLERNKYGDARWVMDFLQQTFPKQLGVDQEKQIEIAKAEAWSLELLESLKLA